MQYDVLIVGAGPAGLATAIKLSQLSSEQDQPISICILEKGSEVGAHIISGAIFEPRALDELIPDWKERGAPLETAVTKDEVHIFRNSTKSLKVPNLCVPSSMHNKGNYIISLGNLCRWLGQQAEALGIEIYTGFAASEVLFDEEGSVKGIATPDTGIGANGERKDSFEAGMELHAKYTIFAEGCRGQLGKQLIDQFQLDVDKDAQHYGIGLKELWEVKPENHRPGLVIHGCGWPLTDASGGSFLYHLEDNKVSLGLILDLNYSNPHLSPFDELQCMKHHPVFTKTLKGGSRLGYGARAITKGGFNSLPKMTLPGALLVGCNAGTLNVSKIKGSHTAMKSGMVAAEVVFDCLANGSPGGLQLSQYDKLFLNSWAGKELKQSRNFGPALHKFGIITGSMFNFVDQLFGGRLPFSLREPTSDHNSLKLAAESAPVNYPKPDGVISFDKLSSVFLTNTYHQEDIFCHLTLKDEAVPLSINLQEYEAPEQRYCPAGVYEIIDNNGKPGLQINGQNCIHCKTCDIKDPTQNIVWIAPSGGGGPNYSNM